MKAQPGLGVVCSGTAWTDNKEIKIQMSHQAEGTSMRIGSGTGFLLHQEGQLVAALDIVNQGYVYLKKNQQPEDVHVLAGVAFSLMTFYDMVSSSNR